MKRRTQWIMTVLAAVSAGGIGEAVAGPGVGPYGPWNSGGAYGGFGPYSPYVRRGCDVSQGLSSPGTTEVTEIVTTQVERAPRARRVTVVEEVPEAVAEREWIEAPRRTGGQVFLDTVTAPVRIVRNVAIFGGRAVGTVVRGPQWVAERIRGTEPEPVAERIVVVERVPARATPHRVVTTTHYTVHRHRPVGRTLKYTAKRTGHTLEHVGERTGRTLKHVAKRTGRTLKHAVHRTGETLESVGERTTVRRTTTYTIRKPAPRPVGERVSDTVSDVGPAYSNADNDYANPYR